MPKKTSVRLPAYIRPERYQIMLKPDLQGFKFEGQETIFLTLAKPTKEITLHAVDLTIQNVKCVSKNVVVAPTAIRFEQKKEVVTFVFNKTLAKGLVELSMEFSGELTDKLKGFYRSKYMHGNEEKYLATTQFESTDARRAFPCFDEPAQKAIFDVILVVPKHMTAISNTIEHKITEHNEGYKVVTFAPSPKMSTYLLAFIVGEMEYTQTKSKHGVLVRVFTTPGKKKQAAFALQTAARALDFYDDYFGIPYPLPVLDLIAIPDFASAAMENWGAITYRESALLFDEEHSSAANKQWVAIVIAHELAHQWFGNLVTMQWWTDLWLNEGFASYMEYLCVDMLFPEWNMWEQYVAERFAVALRLDGLKNSHPIEVEVHNPNEISEIFDQVSYAKGSVVIRMLAEYLGQEVFRDGLRHYLKTHSYKNTVTDDLWKSLEVVSKKPVAKIMKAWTKTTGYPLLKYSEKNGVFSLQQTRFLSSAISQKQTKSNQIWHIPITALDESGQVRQILLDKKTLVVKRKTTGWIKFNFGESTLMRVRYPLDKIEALMLAVVSKKLPAKDRLGLIRDSFALAEAGQCSVAETLQLTRFYKDETELPVWEELAAGIFSAGDFYTQKPWFKLFQEYAQEIYRPIASQLSWIKKSHEAHIQGLLRSLALMQLGNYGDDQTITRAQTLFTQSLRGKSIPPDVRGVVYNLVAQNGGSKEFERMVSMYSKAQDHHEEQERLGRALGNFRNKQILQKVLEFAMSQQVRPQDTPMLFIQVARNAYGRELAWKFLKHNWKTIKSQYDIGGHLLEYFIVPFSRFSSQQDAKKIEQFFKQNPTPSIGRAISQTIERIRSNADWVKRDAKKIEQWLKKNYGPGIQ